ncbi:hypothetical protein PUN28_005000 [Cardiocondyla obscurior]|uniref:Uncharacterized protein n=1 Tax=Cardiocondyla obscurior TaxID=286306 RepID=A0AAW2GG77_9HYME
MRLFQVVSCAALVDSYFGRSAYPTKLLCIADSIDRERFIDGYTVPPIVTEKNRTEQATFLRTTKLCQKCIHGAPSRVHLPRHSRVVNYVNDQRYRSGYFREKE